MVQLDMGNKQEKPIRTLLLLSVGLQAFYCILFTLCSIFQTPLAVLVGPLLGFPSSVTSLRGNLDAYGLWVYPEWAVLIGGFVVLAAHVLLAWKLLSLVSAPDSNTVVICIASVCFCIAAPWLVLGALYFIDYLIFFRIVFPNTGETALMIRNSSIRVASWLSIFRHLAFTALLAASALLCYRTSCFPPNPPVAGNGEHQ